jgi:hypothetical protein
MIVGGSETQCSTGEDATVGQLEEEHAVGSNPWER